MKLQLRENLKELTEINRAKANEMKKSDIKDHESFLNEYIEILINKDTSLYKLFDNLKKEESKTV